MSFLDIRSWAIRRQMLFLGIFPALLMFIFLSSYFVLERLNDVEQRLYRHGNFIIKQLALASEYSVISGNMDVVEKMVSPLLADPEVLYITISDINGNVLFHAKGKARKTIHESDGADDDVLFFVEQVVQQPVDIGSFDERFTSSPGQSTDPEAATVVGDVILAISRVEVKRQQNEILLASSLPAAITLFLTFFLALRIGSIIVEPIIRLSHVARKIKQNDYSARIEGKSGGEIGFLESDINEMAGSLQKAAADQKSLLEKMQAAREQAESGSQAKSDFLAMMSHEIRTPMNGVLGMLQLLETTRLTEKQAEYSKIAIESTSHLLEVINDILDFSRIERGQLSIEPVYFEVRPFFDNIVSPFRYDILRKGLHFSLEYDTDFGQVFVKSDPTRLRQILVNLLSNAIKFTDNGSVVLRVKLSRQSEEELLMTISIDDTGVGIPAEKREKIFLPFLQADTSTSRQYGGTGLGLAIARQLTQLLGGSMALSGRQGPGSCFVCEFSLLYRLDPPATQDYGIKPVLPAESKSYGKVLLVEDNSVNRLVATEMLKLLDIDPDVAEDGEQAVKKYRTNHYNYIFMDIQMPGMDGVAATRAIRAIEESEGAKRTPIIALTAYALEGEQHRCYEAGMDDYLTKPFRQVEIRQKLDAWRAEK